MFVPLEVEEHPKNGVDEKNDKKEFGNIRYVAVTIAIIVSYPLNQNVPGKKDEASNKVNKIENVALNH